MASAPDSFPARTGSVPTDKTGAGTATSASTLQEDVRPGQDTGTGVPTLTAPSGAAARAGDSPVESDTDSEDEYSDEGRHDTGPKLAITLVHAGKAHELFLPVAGSVADLADLAAAELDVSYERQTFVVVGGGKSGPGGGSGGPKMPTSFKHPFSDELQVADVLGVVGPEDAEAVAKAPHPPQGSHTVQAVRQFRLFAPSNETVQEVAAQEARLARRAAIMHQRAVKAQQERAAARAARRRERARQQDQALGGGSNKVATLASLHELSSEQPAGAGGADPGLTASERPFFGTITPLPHLPRPDRALTYLRRLARDPGVRRTMAAHSLTVGTLTELDPVAHTATSGTGTTRTLGLNHNAGAVIELRLRTDGHDGWRGYGQVRKTLCHELAHNRFGPHDADFWAFCRVLEAEVERKDWWRGGGRAVADREIGWEPPEDRPEDSEDEDGDAVDGGGLVGGTYVLGGSGGGEGGENRERESGAGPGSPSAAAAPAEPEKPMTEAERRRALIHQAVQARMQAAKKRLGGDGAPGGT